MSNHVDTPRKIITLLTLLWTIVPVLQWFCWKETKVFEWSQVSFCSQFTLTANCVWTWTVLEWVCPTTREYNDVCAWFRCTTSKSDGTRTCFKTFQFRQVPPTKHNLCRGSRRIARRTGFSTSRKDALFKRFTQWLRWLPSHDPLSKSLGQISREILAETGTYQL